MSRHRHRLVLAIAAAFLAACADANTPTAVAPVAPDARLAPAAERADVALASERLGALERVATARADGRRALDSLQAVWASAGPALQGTTSALLCQPRPYDADVEVIGPEGGVLRAGRHTLAIPPGALRQPTVITMEAPVSLAVRVRFSPHGLTFAAAPTLTLSYKGCAVPPDATMSVVYVDEALNILERPRSRDRRGSVSAEIWHFSDYAVAW
ncbi:MAG TPA: hypothetical protein VFS08_00035 [Gemmatimonadaceae bacterium]|nr:hypothetical protein [Gemmatimonadaceae bacterium]